MAKDFIFTVMKSSDIPRPASKEGKVLEPKTNETRTERRNKRRESLAKRKAK